MAEVELVVESERVAALAIELAAAGRFGLDLEFVSEDRYVAELSLVQLAWGDQVAAVDPLAVDPRPILELIARPELEVVIHAGRQDLALLAMRFGLVAARIWDTQIACALAGIADQIGYGRLVAELFQVNLDKGSQYTDWSRRPLKPSQLTYALDDVRYLLPAQARLLERLGPRAAWVEEESARLARISAERRPPEVMYRTVGGWNGLKGAELGALHELAAWREREALASNTPPSWIAADPALLELARRGARNERELAKIRGIGAPTVAKYGAAMLAAVAKGRAEPIVGVPGPRLTARGLVWSQMAAALLGALAASAGLAPRMVGGKADAEALVEWFEAGESGSLPLLLEGWRAEVVGRPLLGFLRGESAVVAAGDAPGGLSLEPLPPRP